MIFLRLWPLDWPAAKPRTSRREPARFRDGNTGGKPLSLDLATGRLLREIGLLDPLYPSLSTNVRFTRDGRRDAGPRGREDPADPGAVVRFRLGARDYELACDKWDRVTDNIAAIAAHIDALRGQERWGVADQAQAFAGHLALPAPPNWREVLGFMAGSRPSADAIEHSYRAIARTAHPNAGGDRAGWDRVAEAYETAKKELGA